MHEKRSDEDQTIVAPTPPQGQVSERDEGDSDDSRAIGKPTERKPNDRADRRG